MGAERSDSVGGRVEPPRRWQSAGAGSDASYGGGSLMTLDHSSAPILAFRMDLVKGVPLSPVASCGVEWTST